MIDAAAISRLQFELEGLERLDRDPGRRRAIIRAVTRISMLFIHTTEDRGAEWRRRLQHQAGLVLGPEAVARLIQQGDLLTIRRRILGNRNRVIKSAYIAIQQMIVYDADLEAGVIK